MKLVNRLYLLLLLVLAGVGCGTDPADQASAIKVFGGREPTASDPIIKHMVRLELYYKDGTSGLCTGVLISKTHVLTAAHCTRNLLMAAAMFGVKFDAATEIKREDVRLSKWFYSNDFLDVTTSPDTMKDAIKNKTLIKDIAVIRLESEAPEGYEPVNLDDLNQLPNTSAKGATLMGGGYGADKMPKEQLEELKKRRKDFEEKLNPEKKIVKSGPIKVEDLEKLTEDETAPLTDEEPSTDEDDYNVGNLLILDKIYLVQEVSEIGEFVAANPLEMDRAVCMGDSGGPVFVNVEERATPVSLLSEIFGSSQPLAPAKEKWVLFGVASRSDCEQVSIYTDVRKYVDWIKDEAMPAVDAEFAKGEDESLLPGVSGSVVDLSGLDLGFGQ